MKITALVALLLVLLVLGIAFAQTNRSSANAGTYQLVPGEITTTVTKGSDAKEPSVFKINTQTGETWLFSSVFNDGKLIQVWIPIK